MNNNRRSVCSLVLPIALFITTAPSNAYAADPPPEDTENLSNDSNQPPPLAQTAKVKRSFHKLHTISELGLGALTVPQANICIPTQGQCTSTELTSLVVARESFRWTRRFAVGAGVGFGFRPVSEDVSANTPDGPIPRSHSRNYYFLGAHARYYVIQTDLIGLWAGATGGAVIISDSYKTDVERKALLGPKSATVRSEGGNIGLGLGFEYLLTPQLGVGAWTNELLWFMPNERSCSSVQNECSTVLGRVFSLELGLALSYRIWL